METIANKTGTERMGKDRGKPYLGSDFTEGNISKILITFAGPFLLANLLNNLYNMVDMIIIGHFVGSTGTVAVSMGGRMLNLFTHLSTGLAGGGQVLISQQIGAKKRGELNSTIGTLFSLLALVSVALAVVCVIMSRPIIRWMNTPEEAAFQAWSYLAITSAGLPLIFGYNAVCAVLRGMGDSKRPLYFIALATVVNLVLDIAFIVVFHMGATGTALATVIGQGVAFFASIAVLIRNKAAFGFDFKWSSYRINREKRNVIMSVGMPLAAQSCFISITQLFMMSFVNAYGIAQAAAYGVGDKIIQLCNVAVMSIKQAGGTVVAQNLGAGKKERVTQTVWAALRITLSVAAGLSILICVFPNAIFMLFSNDADVLAYSVSFSWITALTLLMSATSSAHETVTLGTGNSKLNFIAGVLDGVVFRIIFSFFFGWTMGMEVVGFFLGNTLARLGPIIVHCGYFYSGKWKNRKSLVLQ